MNWRALEAAVDRTIARTFGERVRLSPMNGKAPDGSRAQTTLTDAVLATEGDDTRPPGLGGQWQTKYSAGEAGLFIDRATYDGPMPKVGDVVRALDRTGQPTWEVAGVNDRHSNLIIVMLTES